METAEQHLVRFKSFELNLRTRELYGHGLRLRLQGHPIDVLEMLLERPGELVTREALQKRLWPEDTFVDFEHGLNNSINRLRESLNDKADAPRFIETLPRLGYRFIAPVDAAILAAPMFAPTASDASPGDPKRQAATPTTDSKQWLAGAAFATATRRSGFWSRMIFGAAIAVERDRGETHSKAITAPRRQGIFLRVVGPACILIIAVAVVLLALNVRGWRDRLFVPAPPIHALAVLPFENLSNTPGEDYFSDGMTEAMISELGRIGGPRVITRQSIMQFKGSKKPLKEIARELHVDALVEGSVQRSGQRVRISIRLAQADPERQLWAEEYNRDARDVLALQAEIARSVSSEIRATLSPEQKHDFANRLPVDPEAHAEYLQGIYYMNKGSSADMDVAVTHLKNSIQRAPTFAPAYAKLARTYFFQAHPASGGPPVKEILPLAKAALAKALELDPSLAEAHLAAGELATSDYNWTEAENQVKTAIGLNPSCAECNWAYGVLLAARGQGQEAAELVKKSIELDPFSDAGPNGLAWFAYMARDYDRSIAQFESLHEAAWFDVLAMSYSEKQRFPEALAAANRCEKYLRHPCLGVQAVVYGRAGRTREAKKFLDQVTEGSRHHYVFPVEFVGAYLGVGDKEQALRWLERAYEEKDPGLFWLKVEPQYDPLRPEPRFQALLRKLNFPE